MVRGLTDAIFGRITFSTPLEYVASTFSASTVIGRVRKRANRPVGRSWRSHDTSPTHGSGRSALMLSSIAAGHGHVQRGAIHARQVAFDIHGVLILPHVQRKWRGGFRLAREAAEQRRELVPHGIDFVQNYPKGVTAITRHNLPRCFGCRDVPYLLGWRDHRKRFGDHIDSISVPNLGHSDRTRRRGRIA